MFFFSIPDTQGTNLNLCLALLCLFVPEYVPQAQILSHFPAIMCDKR